MYRFPGKRYTLFTRSSFVLFLHFGDFRSFRVILRVIFITNVIKLTYSPVFMDIVQRCKFYCVGCWITSRTDLVWAGQMSIFGNMDIFSDSRDNSDAAMENIAMKSLSSCSLVKLQHFDV